MRVAFPLFTMEDFVCCPIPMANTMAARAIAQIQAEEDKQIFEILDNICCCEDPSGTGTCSRCGLPVQKDGNCPIWDITGIMES
jgi:hypothetical protein